MKIINNQDTLLIDEIKSLINESSKVYLSCNYFTAFAIFELLTNCPEYVAHTRMN